MRHQVQCKTLLWSIWNRWLANGCRILSHLNVTWFRLDLFNDNSADVTQSHEIKFEKYFKFENIAYSWRKISFDSTSDATQCMNANKMWYHESICSSMKPITKNSGLLFYLTEFSTFFSNSVCDCKINLYGFKQISIWFINNSSIKFDTFWHHSTANFDFNRFIIYLTQILSKVHLVTRKHLVDMQLWLIWNNTWFSSQKVKNNRQIYRNKILTNRNDINCRFFHGCFFCIITHINLKRHRESLELISRANKQTMPTNKRKQIWVRGNIFA